MEEVCWRQKSRVLWLEEGDKCIKFFHAIANSNHRNNSIESLMIEGNLSNNQPEINMHIFMFYQKILTEQYHWRPLVDGLEFHCILDQVAG